MGFVVHRDVPAVSENMLSMRGSFCKVRLGGGVTDKVSESSFGYVVNVNFDSGLSTSR